ncbi:hypothetical protein C8R45DRAFT_941141 [Mycena sanguinolenta]|nr:hypothetical protein C8R45DRAFT_941141 [Mycena sanguinolenta]
MSFEALGEDVLLKILSFCDISTVLEVSTINKPLSRIAFSKQLWLSLVLDTQFRDALDLPPPDRRNLEGRSTEELIELACLLPGARYIFLHCATQQRLCIYDVWSARRVWERHVPAHTMWKIDSVLSGATARVFLAQSAHLPNPHTKVHVEEVDLTAGTSQELFNCSFASTVVRGIPWAILGDFLLCMISSHSDFHDPRAVLFDLIPGYILSTYKESEPPHQHFLAVRAPEAFEAHWQRLTEEHLATRLAGSAPAPAIAIGTITMQASLEYNGRPVEPDSVTATLDALRAGAYNISVYGLPVSQTEPEPRPVTLMERETLPVPARVLLSYRFTPGQACTGSLRLVPARPVSDPRQMHLPRQLRVGGEVY